MTDEEYENVKKFCQTMKLENLGELNKIYNFQDTIILCEIFEQYSPHLQDLFNFNFRKCNPASLFSGCAHRDKSKCRVALPTENNHGWLYYGCIKKQEHPPSLTEFNRNLDKISYDDNIGHLFIVDIKFNNVNPKTLLFNEIYPPIFEKKTKKMDPYEQSTLQLMSIIVRNEEKEKINSFPYTSKTHLTLK